MSKDNDYLAYKKSKLAKEATENKTPMKKVILWIFVLTFTICFALVINISSRYGRKMDIEYGRSMHSKGSIENVDDPYVKGANPISDFIEERKNQIDIRLRLIQLEETAPNEAKVIDKNKEKTVLDMEHYKALLEEEKIQKELEAAPETETVEKPAAKEVKPAFSKVLIGRYQSFEEAKEAQAELKAENGTTTFIRKMGDIYSLQIGSYTNENLAQEVADKYSGKYSVWILQD